ncbi:hypothetical protein JXM83_03320 [Candidatus Woesearchaeota archaeon]|nr:hypothetical protein [Candidatus Woesearchaeota archaeon]
MKKIEVIVTLLILMVCFIQSDVIYAQDDFEITSLNLDDIEIPEMIAQNYEGIEVDGKNISSKYMAVCVLKTNNEYPSVNSQAIIDKCKTYVSSYSPINVISEPDNEPQQNRVIFNNNVQLKEHIKGFVSARNLSQTRISEANQRMKMSENNYNKLSTEYIGIKNKLSSSIVEYKNCVSTKSEKSCLLELNKTNSYAKEFINNRANIIISSFERFKATVVKNDKVSDNYVSMIVSDIDSRITKINSLSLQIKELSNKKDIQNINLELNNFFTISKTKIRIFQGIVLLNSEQSIIRQTEELFRIINQSSDDLTGKKDLESNLLYSKEHNLKGLTILGDVNSKNITTTESINVIESQIESALDEYKMSLEFIEQTINQYKKIKTDVYKKGNYLFLEDRK